MILRGEDKKAFERFIQTKNRIAKGTQALVPINETIAEKQRRIADLQKDPVRFMQYYFGTYMTDKKGNLIEFAWFHKKAIREVVNDPNTFTIAEWHREAAKSVLFDVMLPMYLYCTGELKGMVVASDNQEKAKGLLSDIQAEFEANKLFINDYGSLAALGSWADGNFSTTDGISFFALGAGQSPRGIREREKRPNFCVVDDIDNKKRCKNQTLVREVVEWIKEDLYGALDMNGARMIIANNRIHKKSVLAHLVGDTEPNAPKNEGITHIKAYAIENPRTHLRAEIDDPLSMPAWKERFTKDHFKTRWAKIGYHAKEREYFHNPIEEGVVFEHSWINYEKVPKRLKAIVMYCDPSYKNTKNSDYKAIVVVGRAENIEKIYILRAWVRVDTVNAMVGAIYDCWDTYGEAAQYWIEASFNQDSHLEKFKPEAEKRGSLMPIRPDRRAKPDKFGRIENMSVYFESNKIVFDEQLKGNSDCETLIQQLLAFPDGNDDAPDALEGAIHKLNKISYQTNVSLPVPPRRKNSRV